MDNLAAVPQYPGNYILARYTNFAFLDAYNNHADPVDSLLQYINTINKEINRKRTEFELEILPIGSTLADKRISQALELIGENSSGQYDAVITACENKDIDEIRAAAASLTGSDETTTQIVQYLNDAADALETYLD